MNKARLLEIVSANPWQTRISLTKLCSSEITGVDAEDHGSFVGDMLNELREQGKIQSTGKARGTRYAVMQAEAYTEPKATDSQRQAVLAAVNNGASTSADVVTASGVEIDLARMLLRELIKTGEIDKTGTTKSTRYWPLGKAVEPERKTRTDDDGSVRKKAPPRDLIVAEIVRPTPKARDEMVKHGVDVPAEPSGIADHGSAQPKVDPLDALRRTFASLPRRSVSRRAGQEIENNIYALDEVLRLASETYGVSRYQCSKLIQDRVLGDMGEDHKLGDGLVIHAQMRYAYKRDFPGMSAYVWRPTKDDDPRPEAYQDRSTIVEEAPKSAKPKKGKR